MIIIVLLVLALTQSSVSYHIFNDKTIKLMDCDAELFGPLLGGAGGSPENQKRKDVLRDCPDVLYDLRFCETNDHLSEDLNIIDFYIDQYNKYGYLPREPYESVPGGEYVTAMDAPLLAVCCQLAFERTNDKKYKNDVTSLIKYFSETPDKHGFMLKESNNSWWPLEYSWENVDQESAWYVYNGSLFGTVAMELLYKATNNRTLGLMLDKVLTSYKSHASEFYYLDNNWTWYSLNFTDGHKIINRSEKMFIEIKALKALYELTNQKFFEQEYKNRIEIWDKLYPVYGIRRENKCYIVFLRAGAPHPYYVDIYPTKLCIYDKEGNEIDTIEEMNRDVSGAYIYEEVPPDASSYKIYGNLSRDFYTLLGSGDITFTEEPNNCKALEYTCDIDGDSQSFCKRKLTLNQDLNEAGSALVVYNLNKPVASDKNGYYLLTINNPSNSEYGIELFLVDKEGNEIYRYYPKIRKGSNTILFNYLGFVGLDQAKFSSVDSIQIHIDDTEQVSTISELEIGDMMYCDNGIGVVDQLRQHSYKDFWTY